MTQQTPSGYLPKRNESVFHTKTYMKVHSSIIHNNPKLETSQMPINYLMDKRIMVYL